MRAYLLYIIETLFVINKAKQEQIDYPNTCMDNRFCYTNTSTYTVMRVHLQSKTMDYI
jgi:hypothetical protein